jgi:hypothetical protein
MRREQRRRGAVAGTAAGWAVRLRRIAGVWTFFALLNIWGDSASAGFADRAAFMLALVGLR